MEFQGNMQSKIYDRSKILNFEWFYYFGGMIIEETRCARKNKSGFVKAKALFNKNNVFSPANLIDI